MKIQLNVFDAKIIAETAKWLSDYHKEFSKRVGIFVQRLAEVGIPVIDQNMSNVTGDSDTSHKTYIDINVSDGKAEAKLVVSGKDILFIEFGAGVYYNGNLGGSPNPNGKEMGYTIGSYGQGKGKNNFWFYYDESGKAKMSRGTAAAMPVYLASLEIKQVQNVRRIAREVFG